VVTGLEYVLLPGVAAISGPFSEAA
jgi:hypothetical protein